MSLTKEVAEPDRCEELGTVSMPSTAQLLNWAFKERKKLEEGLEGKNTSDELRFP